MCGSGGVVCSLSLLIRWAQRARCQAETPLIVLFKFLRPALSAVDKRADAFRYATNPQGDPQMPKNAHVVYHELIAQMDEVRAAIDLAFGEIGREEVRLDRAIDEAVARDRT